jgi:hypothetical protein
MTTYTINISGEERQDGESPDTYAFEAKDMGAAKYAACIFHVRQMEAETGRPRAVALATQHNQSAGESAASGEQLLGRGCSTTGWEEEIWRWSA